MQLTQEQERKVESILAQMTLEEKIGQTNLESPSIVGGFDVPFEELIEMMTDGRISNEEFGRIMATASRDFHEDDIRAGLVGAMMGDDPVKANELQKIAVEESRLGIPLLMGFDVIHGLRTVYPIALAEAGSFDDALFERTARMAAKESRAHGINWNFAPMLDVARDSRWGRVSEGPGEDPRLGARFARAKIRGLQGDTASDRNYVAACMKHYVAYGACEAGRDYNTTMMSISMLHNVYLEAFRAAVEEGAASAMASFNDLNGVPCSVNPYTLRTVLKDGYGMNGFVVSDANGIKECVAHGIAADDEDAGIQAMNAGLDMDMGPHIYKNYLKKAVEEGRVSMEVLDDAVRRILRVKVWLGLFENPYVPEESIRTYADCDVPKEHSALALEAAEKSLVLLKNEDKLLPLDRKQKISLVGKLADSRTEIIGAWAMSWQERDCVSIREGLEKAGANVRYFACGGPEGELDSEEIRQAAEWGDVIVAVLGETDAMSGEASSRADITLPGKQRKLLKKLLKSGKKVVLVLMNGRPLALGWEDQHVPAILEGWHLGVRMGDAVAAALLGDLNPEGKVVSSFPAENGIEPLYYNHPSTGRPGSRSKFTSRYLDAPFEALYPFGFGLSYTQFSYSGLSVKEEEGGGALEICLQLANTGEREGTETVQLYLQDRAASLVRPVKELKDYAKVTLKAGEKKTVRFRLPKEDMGFYDNSGNYLLEDGLFKICAGGSSRDCLEEEIMVKF